MKHLFSLIFAAGLLTTSCSTTESFIHDDTYSVRPSDLPIGESLSDETSYTAWKTRKQGKTNDRLTYADEQALIERQRCLNAPIYCNTCNCTYAEWVQYQRMARPNFYRLHGGMGFSPYNYFGLSQHYYPPYMYGYNPYGMMNNGYIHYNNYGFYPYGGWYGYGGIHSPYSYNSFIYNGFGYGGYGFGGYGAFGGYGYGGNSNGWSNGNHQSSNVIRGPRGTTASGNYNPNGRASNANMIKSTTAGSTGKGGVVTSGRQNTVKPDYSSKTVDRKPVSNTSRISTPVTREVPRNSSNPSLDSRGGRTPYQGTVSRPTSSGVPSGRPAANPASQPRSTGEYQRTYPSRTAAPSSTGRPETGTSRPAPTYNSSGRPASPAGNYSSPSRSSSPASGGYSGGSSRSGGTVGGSTGRR